MSALPFKVASFVAIGDRSVGARDTKPVMLRKNLTQIRDEEWVRGQPVLDVVSIKLAMVLGKPNICRYDHAMKASFRKSHTPANKVHRLGHRPSGTPTGVPSTARKAR